MKKNDVLIGTSAIAFSCLFYKQLPGINYPLFTLLISSLIAFTNPEKLKDKSWMYYCLCCNLAGWMVFVINSDLSVFACIVSLLVLGGKSASRENSVAICFLFSLYSLFASYIMRMAELIDGRNENKENRKAKTRRMIFSSLLALIIACLFFYLYRQSNPLFNSFANSIDLSWLDFGLICFTLFGLLVVYGLVKGRRINLVASAELMISADLDPVREQKPEGSESSGLTAILLFILLNIMLLITNCLDINHIYITQKLPAGISLSDFVHQAVWSTVFSIVVAVALITWFFKGWLNFDPASRTMRLLVYIWIAQSALVVVNTIIRNHWYIQEYQLTHLRIGVFAFLLLSLVGLFLTWVKISNHLSAWRLATKNFEIWFFVLIFSSCIHWDKVITQYNITHATSHKVLDTRYLLELSDGNLPQLVELHNSNKLDAYEKNALRKKVLGSYHRDRFQQWPSFNLRMKENREALMEIK